MKKILLFIAFLGNLMVTKSLSAQTFSMHADTVYTTINTTATAVDYVVNDTNFTINMQWRVTACNFPADWLDSAAFGICDDQYCRANGSGQLWNGTSGSVFTAPYYANSSHDSIQDFHVVMNLPSSATSGTYYVTTTLRDITNGTIGAPTKTATFVFNKWAEGIGNINNLDASVNLYPNPAHNEVNLVYNPGADVKNITVYNIIGKLMAVYKVTENNSANLNIENLPSGIYFARLLNSQGNVVVTRKFTKQ